MQHNMLPARAAAAQSCVPLLAPAVTCAAPAARQAQRCGKGKEQLLLVRAKRAHDAPRTMRRLCTQSRAEPAISAAAAAVRRGCGAAGRRRGCAIGCVTSDASRAQVRLVGQQVFCFVDDKLK